MSISRRVHGPLTRRRRCVSRARLKCLNGFGTVRDRPESLLPQGGRPHTKAIGISDHGDFDRFTRSLFSRDCGFSGD